MISVETTTSPSPVDDSAGESAFERLWKRHSRAGLTMVDQGLVSVASFATNFLLLRHFASDASHYAYYTLAFNLMIWVAEFHATLVFTPHTILSPRRHGDALRRFHGSTLLHHFAVSLVATAALLIASLVTRDHEMSTVLLTLGVCTIVIGLRNYARPYSFTARRPHIAVLLDLAVCVLQIGGVLLLGKYDLLTASTAILVIGGASAVPALIWLAGNARQFKPSPLHAVEDLKFEWPNTRWVFLSGMVWNAGMQLYPWVIMAMAGKGEVAIWGACYQLAAVANPLLMGLQNFIGPRIAEAYTERTPAEFCRMVYRIGLGTAALMIGPAVLLSIFANAALAWLSRGHFAGHQLAITFLCAAIVIQAITFTISRGLFALHRADLDLYCNFGPLVLLFTAGTALTLHYGATGAAASMLLAQIVSGASRAILFARATRPAIPQPLPTPIIPLRGAA